MDNLRLILILIGLVILAAIVLFHRPPGESRRNHARWGLTRREPRLDGLEDTPEEGAERRSDNNKRTEPVVSTPAESSSATTAEVRREPSLDPVAAAPAAASAPEKIITLYVKRREERTIDGSDLLDAAEKAGLQFGEMNIFHRRQQGGNRPVFSMANLTAPGSFDPSSWNTFKSPGVTLFATLPAPVSALDAWDAMLATGKRLAELLQADVLDDARCLLTRQRIAQVREEMREYDRRHGLPR